MISVISIAFVVVSTVGMTLNTIPEIQHHGPPTDAHPDVIELIIIER